jgi:hypothetical protein
VDVQKGGQMKNAIEVLRKQMKKDASELYMEYFEDYAYKKVAEKGNKEVEDALRMGEFTKKLFGLTDLKKDKEKNILEYCKAIVILEKSMKEEDK